MAGGWVVFINLIAPLGALGWGCRTIYSFLGHLNFSNPKRYRSIPPPDAPASGWSGDAARGRTPANQLNQVRPA